MLAFQSFSFCPLWYYFILLCPWLLDLVWNGLRLYTLLTFVLLPLPGNKNNSFILVNTPLHNYNAQNLNWVTIKRNYTGFERKVGKCGLATTLSVSCRRSHWIVTRGNGQTSTTTTTTIKFRNVHAWYWLAINKSVMLLLRSVTTGLKPRKYKS